MANDLPRIDCIEGLTQLLRTDWRNAHIHHVNIDGEMYCTTCGSFRRMHVFPQSVPDLYFAGQSRNEHFPQSSVPAPSLFLYQCANCHALYTVTVAQRSTGHVVVVVADDLGGLATPNTPAEVRHYLDQALTSEWAGAPSAAMAMYRSGLESILFEQGFTTRMLGSKLEELEQRIKADTAPPWAKTLDTRFLSVLNRLANMAIHPGAVGIENQLVLDAEVLASVKVTFVELLDLVYEEEARRKSRLQVLLSANQNAEGNEGASIDEE